MDQPKQWILKTIKVCCGSLLDLDAMPQKQKKIEMKEGVRHKQSQTRVRALTPRLIEVKQFDDDEEEEKR